VVDLERAAGALLLLPRVQHEEFDEQLAAAVEEVRQGPRSEALWKNVGFLDLDPGQRPLFGAQGVAARVKAFPGDQGLARGAPRFAGDDFMLQ